MKKKVLFYLLMVSLAVLLLPAVAFAARFSDMPEDWSTNALQNAVDNGLLTGANGRIMPKDTLTRAQMAVIISRAFGATEKAVLDGYTDVSPGAWYYDDMARVVQMKSFMGSGDKLDPNKAITREEAFVVLARAFKLSGSSVSILDKYTDKSEVSSWAKDSTASLVAATYITGTDGRLNPKQNITRAEFAQIMYNLLKNYIRSSGTYTDVAEGNVMINVPDVTLKDVTVKGDLIIGDGVGAGDVTLENVKVTGRTVVRGGGINSIKIIGNSEVGSVIIAKVNGNVRVVAETSATVEVVYIDDGKDDVVIEGTIGSIEVAGSNVPVRLQNAQVENVTISAQEVNLTVANTATVNKVTVSQTAEGTSISGEGTVKNAIIQGDNISFDTIGTKIEVGKAVSGTEIGGQSIAGGAIGTTNSNGGLTLPSSGGGGGSSTVAVSTITVTGQGDATTVINGGTLQLSATVTPANATNKTIAWSVAPLAGGAATIDENGLLTGAGAGTVLVTATNSASGVTGTLEVTVITVDKSELTAAITAAVGTDHENPVYVLAQADYTSTTWASYAEAIAAAIAVETNVNAVQSEVDVVLEQIITTKTALVFAGQADLDATKATAGALSEGDYTTATWSVLETALALPETSNAEVVAKTTAINNAIAGLIEVADLTAYNAALAAVVEADYTQESWDMYQTVVDGSTVTDQNLQAEVNTATAAIIAAQANLVFAGQADLDAAKAAAGALSEGDYTTASWAVLTNAWALPETTNAEVVTKTAAINNAIAGLVLFPANSSYALEIALPEQTIISSQEATFAVTLSEAVIGRAGYDNVRVNVTTSGGTIVQVPVAWGAGFAIGAEYNTTENISVLYSAGGNYDLTVTLVDANNGDQVLDLDTVSVHVYSAVGTAVDLYNVRNNLAGDYIQVANIDLIGYPDWDPIGGLYNKFTGSYNGNGYEISNLTAVIDSDYNYGGLFGEIWGTVENVTLKGVTITSTAQYPYAMGGLAGYLGETGIINNCSAEVSITGSGTAYVGGLVGWAYSGIIEQSSAVGSVSQSGNGDTGGLVGGSRRANIRRSFAAVDVSSNGYSAGGLVGNNGGLIEQSYATGDVTSTNYWVGGLVGDNRPFDVPCIVSECYATGKVTGAGSFGGLIGLSLDATVQQSYYDMNTTGCTDVGKGIPKTTVEMMQQATFADWDFSDTWIIGEGITYPYFQWQSL